MAVAMETTAAWRGSEPAVKTTTTTKTTTKKNYSTTTTTAWGADAQKLMQLMMGQLHSSSEPSAPDQLSTLDLFRHADPPCSQLASPSPEFLGLEPEEPLPAGWEKCLDLKSGKLYFVQRSAGVSTFNDPRKQQLQSNTNQLSPREFLGSKKSETLSLKASSSSSSESPRKQSAAMDLLQQKPRWSLQLDDVTLATSCEEQERKEDSNVELDLNLAAGGPPSPRRQTVCTMAMIKNALQRTENQSVLSSNAAVGKRKLQHKLSTVSSSFSSLTSTRSDPLDSSCVAPSPSTSSSSSTSSKSRRAEQPTAKPSSTSTEICDDDDDNVALVMGACTRCLMYVMLKKMDPKCPRCESEVPVDFSGPPCKRQMVGFQRR